MALSHGTATRTAAADTVVDRVDVSPPGKLKFLTSADAVLCTITLANPAFGAAVAAVATLLGVPLQGTVTTGGTVAKFWITNGADVTIIAGTVGISASDINISSVVVAVSDIIQINAITYTSMV
jgi:hypothetical protein